MSFNSRLYKTYSHLKLISLVSYIVTPNFLYIYISYVLYMCIWYTCSEIILHILTGDIDCDRGLVVILLNVICFEIFSQNFFLILHIRFKLSTSSKLGNFNLLTLFSHKSPKYSTTLSLKVSGYWIYPGYPFRS